MFEELAPERYTSRRPSNVIINQKAAPPATQPNLKSRLAASVNATASTGKLEHRAVAIITVELSASVNQLQTIEHHIWKQALLASAFHDTMN